MKKILFGAGKYGKYALLKYGKENVAYFVDNNVTRIGNRIDGIEIISFVKLLDIYRDYEIVISTQYVKEVENQLNRQGIYHYTYFKTDKWCYYPTNELIVNPYEMNEGIDNDYIDTSGIAVTNKINAINNQVDELYGTDHLFDHVEIETVNRCNGGCSFCPVSIKNDTREFKKMEEELFYKIINELEGLSYSGRLALFSNNEPFLDERIIKFHQYARERLPRARMHLFTNGTLLTVERFVQIMEYLDELVIDNYHQELKLIGPCRKIKAYCEEHPQLKSKVTIVLRKVDEVLTTRGGDAPNARLVSYPGAKCVLPYRQLIIRPDGKVSLCCNDALGRNTLGDVSKDSVLDVWNNDRFRMVRECLHRGRSEWKHCQHCDFFSVG